MAAQGVQWAETIVVPNSPTSVIAGITQGASSGGNYFDQSDVRPTGMNSIQIVRRYVPTWAIVLAILGSLLFLIGLLLLLVRTTEILQIAAYDDVAGSRVDINGICSTGVSTQLKFVLTQVARPGGAPPVTTPRGQGGVTMRISDSTVPSAGSSSQGGHAFCEQCGSSLSTGASFCSRCGTRSVSASE